MDTHAASHFCNFGDQCRSTSAPTRMKANAHNLTDYCPSPLIAQSSTTKAAWSAYKCVMYSQPSVDTAQAHSLARQPLGTSSKGRMGMIAPELIAHPARKFNLPDHSSLSNLPCQWLDSCPCPHSAFPHRSWTDISVCSSDSSHNTHWWISLRRHHLRWFADAFTFDMHLQYGLAYLS